MDGDRFPMQFGLFSDSIHDVNRTLQDAHQFIRPYQTQLQNAYSYLHLSVMAHTTHLMVADDYNNTSIER